MKTHCSTIELMVDYVRNFYEKANKNEPFNEYDPGVCDHTTLKVILRKKDHEKITPVFTVPHTLDSKVDIIHACELFFKDGNYFATDPENGKLMLKLLDMLRKGNDQLAEGVLELQNKIENQGTIRIESTMSGNMCTYIKYAHCNIGDEVTSENLVISGNVYEVDALEMCAKLAAKKNIIGGENQLSFDYVQDRISKNESSTTLYTFNNGLYVSYTNIYCQSRRKLHLFSRKSPHFEDSDRDIDKLWEILDEVRNVVSSAQK